MKKPLIIHPFLFAIVPVLFLYSHNISEVELKDSVIPAAIIIAFSLIMWISLSAILKNKIKAGIITSLSLIIIFSHGHIYTFINNFAEGGGKIIRSRHLIPAWIIIFACTTFFTIKAKAKFYNLTKILNVIAAFLVLINLFNISVFQIRLQAFYKDSKNLTSINISTVNPEKIDRYPDIYYIILDRYGSTSTFKELYNYDNSEFIDFLISKGFYVASESVSNYPSTPYSLASSLNMQYINYLSNLGLHFDMLPTVAYDKLRDYRVWRFLKSKEYIFIHFGSWWGPTSKNKHADMNFNLLSLSNFSSLIFGTTMLNPIFQKLGIYDPYKQHWKRVLYKFDVLNKMPDIKEPTFVFAHMLIPHDPYVFDRNGNYLTQEEACKRKRGKNYIDQLIFLNKKLIVLVDTLLSKSKVPPIIILQSDEGPYPERQITHSKTFNLSEASNKELREKMRIFNAYYLPNGKRDGLYKSITPINSFRIVFNLYFNTNLELLPDQSYIIEKNNHLIKFVNVTDRIKY